MARGRPSDLGATSRRRRATMLGIELTDGDVAQRAAAAHRPLRQVHPRPATASPQVVVGIGPDGIPNTGDDIVVDLGDPVNPVDLI